MTLTGRRRGILATCCGAHAIQDGLSAALYVILPVLAQTFGLSFAQIGILRAVNNGAMALFEMSSGLLAERVGERNLLVFGLACAGFGYMGLVVADTIWIIGISLFVMGLGGAFQHALSSSVVSSAYDANGRRAALGLYNSSGDAGKLTFTALFNIAAGIGISWQGVAGSFGVAALIGAVAVFVMLFMLSAGSRRPPANNVKEDGRALGWGIENKSGFVGLCVAVFLDTAIQAGFLTFLAFFIAAKDVSLSLATLAVTLTLVGGMLGKAACGFLAERIGTRWAFTVVQCLSAVGILAVLASGKVLAFALLPVLGIVLQGSTSVTYGVVGDLVHGDRVSRGFALIYTVSALSGLLGPIFFGLLTDHYGIELTMFAMATVSLLAIPPILLLRPKRAEQKVA